MSSLTFMDDQKSSEVDKVDDHDHDHDHDHEVILPGFRFHPTDEELIRFYLRKKIQNQIIPNDLIKQVDIYKYDPWDLPSLAPLGEKEWYFYCPRDRKYKNSARPNRVTGAGFWKATGTDRPIYSSNGGKCIGLKKSLVFYRGRAAKGMKTDWMMHEFRLPSVVEPEQNKKIQEKNLSPSDTWAICKIFKKTNSTAQRAISHSWVSSLSEDRTSEFFAHSSHVSPDNISSMTGHLCYTIKPTSTNRCLTLETQLLNQTNCKPSPFPLSYVDFSTNEFLLSPANAPQPPFPLSYVDFGRQFLNLEDTSKNCENIDFGGEHQLLDNFPMNHYCENHVPMDGFPFSLPTMVAAADESRFNTAWDSPTCHSSSTTYSTNNCHI